ncbi:MAG: ATP-binding protein [Candidatus Micrarchaeota archaeon]
MANPFTPGNGIEPRYLAGRERYLEEFAKSLETFEGGLPQNTVVYGLRGTGKTVLARHFKIIAESRGWSVIEREFNEKFSDEALFGNSLTTDIASKASEVSIAKRIEQTGKKLLEALKPETLSAYGITYKPYYKEENKLLADYLKEILSSNWPVFKKAGKKGVLLIYDEMHNVRDIKESRQYPLSSLLEALSYVQRQGCRYYLCVCGLPTLKTNLKEAKTYTERMFNFQETANLTFEQAKKAMVGSLKGTKYSFEDKLISHIVSETNGYPYFVQFYGYFLVEKTAKNSIGMKDFDSRKKELLDRLDRSFFEDRFNLASGGEQGILLAMAKIDSPEAPTAEISRRAEMNYNNLMQLLIRLTEKGIIYRIKKGKYAFTIPLFKDYLKRRY